MKELGKDKALIINTIASFVTFIVGLGIAFFFTPFLTDTVGEEAYGFVSLGNNVINYITILTVALNSVAGRFITIEYHQGKKKEANEYFSSVLMANIAIIPVILAVAVPVILNAEKLLDIPVELEESVKLLFFFILFNFIITLISTVYNVATFITNRLYLSSIANIVTALLRVFLMCLLFGMLPPNVAYIGIVTCICTFVGLVMNMYYTRLLVPDIRLKKCYVHWIKVKELISAGMWNSISRLSQVLTMYYAKDDTEAVVKELKLSMKFSSFFVNIIFCILVIFGKYFMQLWVPNQDVNLIYSLLVVIMMSLLVSGVTTSLNNVFLVTNRLKVNSIFWLIISFTNVLLVFIFLNTTSLGIYAVAGVSKVTGILGNLIFVPLYACKCLKIKWNTFYPIIFRYIGTTFIMMIVFFGIKRLYVLPINWITFFVVCVIAGFAGCIVNFFVLLNHTERSIMKNKIMARVRK